VIPIESHPYLQEAEILEFCKTNGLAMLAFCADEARDEAWGTARSSHSGDRAPGQQNSCASTTRLGNKYSVEPPS